MTKEDLDTIVSNLDEYLRVYGHKTAVIAFFGGEPLIRYDLIKYFIETYGKDERIVRIIFPTNGLLMDQEKFDYLKSHDVGFTLSFDGLWNKTNRPLQTGGDSFTEYMKRIQFFKQFGRSRCMVSNDNVSTLVDNYRFFIEGLQWPFMDFAFIKEGWTPEGVETFNKTCPQLVDKIVEYWKSGIPNMPTMFREKLEFMLALGSRNKSIRACEACSWMISFFPDGNAYPCGRFAHEHKYPILNYRTNEWYPENMDLFSRPDILVPDFVPKCKDCEVKFVCMTGCLNQELKQCDGEWIKEPLDGFCEVTKITIRESLRLFDLLKDFEPFQKYFTDQITKFGGQKSWKKDKSQTKC
jgi:uncharacterized protein